MKKISMAIFVLFFIGCSDDMFRTQKTEDVEVVDSVPQKRIIKKDTSDNKNNTIPQKAWQAQRIISH